MSKKFAFLIIVLAIAVHIFSLLASAQDGVYVSKPSHKVSRVSIEEFTRQVVLESFRNYVHEIMRSAVRQSKLPFSSDFVNYTSMDAAYKALAYPSVARVIKNVYAQGIKEAMAQSRKMVSQLVMEENVQKIVEESIPQVASNSEFQQALDMTLQQAIGQYKQNNLYQAVSSHQQNQASMRQRYNQSISSLLQEAGCGIQNLGGNKMIP